MLHVAKSLKHTEHEMFFPLQFQTLNPPTENKLCFKIESLKGWQEEEKEDSRVTLDFSVKRESKKSPFCKTLKGLYSREDRSLADRHSIGARLMCHNRWFNQNQQFTKNFHWSLKRGLKKNQFKIALTMPPYSMLTSSRPEFFSGFLGMGLKDETETETQPETSMQQTDEEEEEEAVSKIPSNQEGENDEDEEGELLNILKEFVPDQGNALPLSESFIASIGDPETQLELIGDFLDEVKADEVERNERGKKLKRKKTETFTQKYKSLYEKLTQKRTAYFSLATSMDQHFLIRERMKSLILEMAEEIISLKELSLEEQNLELSNRETKKPKVSYKAEPVRTEKVLESFETPIIMNYSPNPLIVESPVMANIPLLGKDEDPQESAWQQWCVSNSETTHLANLPPPPDTTIEIGYHLLPKTIDVKTKSKRLLTVTESLRKKLKSIFKNEFGLQFSPIVVRKSGTIVISDKNFDYQNDFFKLNLSLTKNLHTPEQRFSFCPGQTTFSKAQHCLNRKKETVIKLQSTDQPAYHDPFAEAYPITICLEEGSGGVLAHVKNFGMVDVLGIMHDSSKMISFNKILKDDETELKIFLLNKDGKKIFLNDFKFWLHYTLVAQETGKNPTVYL